MIVVIQHESAFSLGDAVEPDLDVDISGAKDAGPRRHCNAGNRRAVGAITSDDCQTDAETFQRGSHYVNIDVNTVVIEAGSVCNWS